MPTIIASFKTETEAGLQFPSWVRLVLSADEYGVRTCSVRDILGKIHDSFDDEIGK